MKKILTLCAFSTFLFVGNLNAQLAIGANVGMLQSTEDNSEALIGGEINGKLDISDKFRVGITLGVYQKKSETLGLSSTFSAIPVFGLAEYRFLDGPLKPYVGVHVGMTRFKVDIESLSSTTDGNLTIAPVLGADLEITESFGLNFNFKFGYIFYDNDLTESTDNYTTISPNLGIYLKF